LSLVQKEKLLKQISKRLTYANVMSSIAVFLVLGGATAFAASQLGKNSVGTKQLKKNAVTASKIKKNAVTGKKIKKNAVTGAKVKDHSLTGSDIDLSKLGTVPDATHAGTADSVASVIPFSAGANEDQMVSLAKTSSFELMGICDINDTFDPPGVQFEDVGTSFVIYNRGASPAFADTEDDDDFNLTTNQGVIFNYDDNRDGGLAMSVDGHFLSAASWANLQADVEDIEEPDPSDNYPFPTTCHFAGAALVG
jgi:hypothetical protein